MSGSVGSGNIFAAYAVVKAHEPSPGDTVDAHASRAALDEQELQELEAELYGEGAGPAHPTAAEPTAVEPVHGALPRLRRPRG